MGEKSDPTKVQLIMLRIPQASALGIYNLCSIRLNTNNKIIAGD
jgi:hypothetical protein